MKSVLLIFIVAILTTSQCNVTNLLRTAEETVRLSVENETQENRAPKTLRVNNNETSKVVPNENNRVYLEDVIFALRNQNWTSEEEPCLNQTLLVLRSLQNFTLWAVWNWDSMSSEPQGLLYGNKYQLGNFDECINAPWFETNPELLSQYCLAEIVLERTDNIVKETVNQHFKPYQSTLDVIVQRINHMRPLNELTWGVCVPATCQPQSVERLLAIMLARSHLGAARIRANININEPCQRADEPRQFDGLFYAFICFVCVLTIATLVCTYANCNKRENDSSKSKLTNNIIKAFCLKENSKSLLRMKKDGLEVLYGIKFLTMTFIVMGHQIGIFNAGPISDGLLTDQKVLSSTFTLFLIHEDLFVDTFFVISGMLTATTLTSIRSLPSPLLLLLKRYIRLIIALAMVIFYVCAVYPFTGSGPLWLKAIAADTDLCRKNWWLNMLMLSNYVDSENMCIVISWYIPCDFHFFIIALFICWIYKKHPWMGILCAVVITFASIFVSGYINYVYNLPAILLFTYDFVKDPRASMPFHLTYIKSHTRFGAYAVGFLAGYLFSHYSELGNNKRISQKLSVLGICASLVLMLAVMVLGSTFLRRDHHIIEATVYAALNRPVWAIGTAAFILCCALGRVPLLSQFLSWYPWVPLSKLSYGLYLTHSIFISHNVFVTRNPQHNDYAVLLNSVAGQVFWGCVVAYIIWLLAEAPANNLLTMFLKSKSTKTAVLEDMDNKIRSASDTNMDSVNKVRENKDYFKDNLPSSIQISSKI